MLRSPKPYLQHIFAETEFLIEHSTNLTLEDFLANDVLQKAFVRSLEIIGEATKQLPQDFRNKYKEINWKAMAGMRDKLIHDYFGVDYMLVYDVIKNEIPKLHDQIAKLDF